MLTIYSEPVSLYCAKLRVLMRHKTLHWNDLPPPGGYGSDEYRAIVPSGNLPAMVHDGFMLADSEAIAEYLEETFPETPMLPDTIKARAKVREMGRLHDTRLEPAVRLLYPHVAYDNRDDKAVRAAVTAIDKALASLDLLLSQDDLPTGQLWLGDCGFVVCFAWIKAFETALCLPITWPDAVVTYDQQLNTYPAVRAELAAYAPAMAAYLRKAEPPGSRQK
ncbi:MAG: glutathione S-transferase N-terminal domain-containing protein [Pseudomonadota bacterium]